MTFETNAPFISSLLDTDAYKLYMQQAIYHQYPHVKVEAQFHCRTDENLLAHKANIQTQINALAKLQLTEEEYQYLAALPYFKTDYLDYLKTFRFNPKLVSIKEEKGDLSLHILGSWLDVILWEIPLLAIISETRAKANYPQIKVSHAIKHLKDKIKSFKSNTSLAEQEQFKLVDFGTRRRFSFATQEAVIQTLSQEFSGFNGTSNLHFAMKYDLNPVGTQAHEWFQAHQQLTQNLADFQTKALDAWLVEYPDKLLIALTDCINMDAFLRDFNQDFANRFDGLRHDSGDPILWANKAVAHYQALNIDPTTKTLVFSDGLSLDSALKIYRELSKTQIQNRPQLSFGIGTQLTCDIPSVKPLNIVLKLTQCEGKPVAKISDEPGKSLCHDQAYLQKLKDTFHLS